jgi:thioredoxin 1
MGHATVEITAANFKETVEKPGILFLDFWAAWCGPCRAFAPIFEEVAGKNPDLVFGKVNTEEEQALAGAFQVRSIPTLMIFRDGVLLFSQPGMLPAEALAELVTKVKELDMTEVKAEVARRMAEEEKAGAPAADES